MNAIPKLPPEGQMTIEEFLELTRARPDGERWELIEGMAVLNPSPVQTHQLVATNIATFFMRHKQTSEASWVPLLGVGTRVPVSPNSLPQPDVYVQAGLVRDEPVTDDALVIFEILSRSNTRADQAWRRKVYASVENCQHYVTVSLRTPEVVVFDRATGWTARKRQGLDTAVELSALAVSLPMSAVYQYTPLGSV